MKRLVPFVVLIVILLGILVGVPLLLQPDAHRGQLSEYLSQKLQHRVLIAKLDAGFFPPKLRLHDVEILGTEDEGPMVRISRVDVSPDWGRLFRAKIAPSTITFVRWFVTVHRNGDGSWNWQELIRPTSEATSSSGWPLKRIILQEGECHFADLFSPGPAEVVLQSANGTLDIAGQRAQLSGNLGIGASSLGLAFNGQGHFLISPSWTGELKFTDQARAWTLQMEKKDGLLDVKGTSDEWRAATLWNFLCFFCRWGLPNGGTTNAADPTLTGWKSHFSFQASTMTFYHAATLGGGFTELKGGISAQGDHSVVSGAGTLQGVALSALGATLGREFFLDGKATAVTHFEMGVASRPWTSMTGQGEATITDGRFRLPAATLKSLSKAKTMGYLRAKVPAFADEGISYRKLSLRWHGAKNTVVIESARLDSDAFRVTVAGSIDGEKEGVDAYTRLLISEGDPSLVRLIPGHYIYGPTGHEEIQPIYGRLQGSWSEWSVRAVTPSKIPAAIQSRLH